uniref:Galactose oxidase n=3 Tax=Palpitomonas bilix TaxID=652834 RepID=A0A7S3FZR5_9EUKA|mmetsp:Transcript_13317/g.34913  ORF Transcript_13317/g.34913 Transcript_13317/m.34913 type:complete len:311 (+) Transcript_13317:177-1109(+)
MASAHVSPIEADHVDIFGRQGHVMGTVDGKVIMAGGSNDDHEDGSVWCFSEVDGWEKLHSDAKFGYGSAAATCPDGSGDLLIFGGSNLLGTCTNEVLRVSADKDGKLSVRIVDVKGQAHARCNMHATTVGDRVFVTGGFDGAEHLEKVEVYRPDGSGGLVVENMPLPKLSVAPRSLHSSVVVDGKLYLIGGEMYTYSGTEFQPIVYLDLEKRVWEQVRLGSGEAEKMTRRAGAASVDMGDGKVLLFGGWSHAGEENKPRVDAGIINVRDGKWTDVEIKGSGISGRAGVAATRGKSKQFHTSYTLPPPPFF